MLGRIVLPWALLALVITGAGGWIKYQSVRLEATEERLTQTQAQLEQAHKQMVVVATTAAAAKVRLSATFNEKSKVLHEQDAPVPPPIRAALDGVRRLRGDGN